MSADEVNKIISPLNTVALATGVAPVTDEVLREIGTLIPPIGDPDRENIEAFGSLIGNWPSLVVNLENALATAQEAALAGETSEDVLKLHATELGVAIYNYVTAAIVMTVVQNNPLGYVAGPYPVTGAAFGEGLGKLA